MPHLWLKCIPEDARDGADDSARSVRENAVSGLELLDSSIQNRPALAKSNASEGSPLSGVDATPRLVVSRVGL